jgi:hypothetical protein
MSTAITHYLSSVFLTVVLSSASIRPVPTGERMRKSETLNLRVSPEFKRRLIAEAKKDKRSVTNYLEVTLTNVWKQEASSKKGSRKVNEEDLNS